MAKNIQIPNTVDVAIIGSGMGGLTAALELAHHGFTVAVFEKRPVHGGYSHSFRRKGFVFDVALHHLGGLEEGGMTYNLLKPYNVLPKLDYKKKDHSVISYYNGIKQYIPNSKNECIRHLCKLFPYEEENIVKLFDYLETLKYHVVGPVLYPDFDVHYKDLLSIQSKSFSFKQTIEKYISDPDLLLIITQLWMYLGLAPEDSQTNYATCVFNSTFIESSYHIAGGGAAFASALVSALEEKGGQCFCRNGVEKVIVEDGAVSGVQLEGGKIVKAQTVISNASPYDTFFNLVDKKHTSKLYRYRIEHYTPSFSTYAMYIGLDCLPSELGIDTSNFFYNHQKDLKKAYFNCLEGNIENTDWSLTSYEDDREGNAPDGCGSISIAELTPPAKWFDYDDDTYKSEKERVKNILLDKYEKVFPGLKKHAVVIEFGTPRTMKRYSGNHMGAIYGSSNTFNDPKSRNLGIKSPVDGLFLTGAWVQDGGGFEGSMMSGIQTVNTILKEKGIKRRHLRSCKSSNETSSAFDKLPYTSYATVYPDDVSNSNTIKLSTYLRFLDRARVDLQNTSDDLKSINYLFDNHYVNVYKITSEFRSHAKLDDKVTIKTDFKKITSHRAALDQVILDRNNTILCECRTEIMFITHTGELIKLPAVYKEKQTSAITVSKAQLPPVLKSNTAHFIYEHLLKVYYEDTDSQGIVYNVSYFRFCERALWAIHKQINELAGKEIIKPSHIEQRFLKAAHLYDVLSINIGVRRIFKSDVAVDFRIINSKNQDLLFEAYWEYTEG